MIGFVYLVYHGVLCPSCASLLVKKNGPIHNGKQNHRCLAYQLQFVDEVVATLPKDLNAQVVKEDDDIELVLLRPMNNGVMLDLKTRCAFYNTTDRSHASRGSEQTTSRESLCEVARIIKKKPSIILTTSMCTTKQSAAINTNLSEKNRVRHPTMFFHCI